MGWFKKSLDEVTNDALIAELYMRRLSANQVETLRQVYEEKERELPVRSTVLPEGFNDWSFPDKYMWFLGLDVSKMCGLVETLESLCYSSGKSCDEIMKARCRVGYEKSATSKLVIQRGVARRLMKLLGIEM